MGDFIHIDVLGELRVRAADGEAIALPASRKTKALLAYLALTGRRQFREHLCSLLWDGAQDPRGALRWSLSRLRAVLDTPGERRIESDRKSIALAGGACAIDVREVERALSAPTASHSHAALRDIAARFRGELLEGIELLESFRFHSWCVAQRENARSLRLKVLRELSERVDDPDEALQYAYQLVSIDPLSEEAHSRVIRLLMQVQRHADAMNQADTYRRTLEIELGEVPRDVAARLRKLVHHDASGAPRVAAPVESPRSIESLPLVGRADELATLRSWIANDGRDQAMALIVGEPGVGKTRLMNEVVHGLGDRAVVVEGRAYRAESARALGPWRDAFRRIDGAELVLTSAADAGAEQHQRAQLFDELLALLATQGAIARRVVIAIDDVQWLDEASAAFLHFLARSRLDNVVVIGTLRAAEVVDNPAVDDALDSLRSQGAVLDLDIAPLDAGEIAELCAAVDGSIDAADVFGRSDGNPFVATELAHALARGETELPTNTQHLVEARLRALTEPARDLLPWAAALGRTFHIDVLERVTGIEPLSLVERIGELERRGVLEARDDGDYDFVHDLVRDAAYRELSAPRRRIVHRRIARSLAAGDRAGVSAAELLRHAELGSEAAIACRAAVAAARDALSVYGWVDVCSLADRGLQHTKALDADERIAVMLELVNCRVATTTVLERAHPEHVRHALTEILAVGGTAKQRARALYLQAIVHRDDGQGDRARTTMVEAADAGRKGDPETAARQVANTARCLLHLERDVDKARSLLAEAQEGLATMQLEDVELYWAEGLLARWDGDLETAADKLLQAIRLAKQLDHHWRQSSCLTALIMIACESGDPALVEDLARGRLVYEEDGLPLASPFVEAMAGLADFQRDPQASARLDDAIDVLRSRGAHAQLSYVLAATARVHAERGELDEAEEAAGEAADLAAQLPRFVVQTDALLTLAQVRLERGDRSAATAALAEAEAVCRAPDTVTARVRQRLETVATAINGGR